MDINNISLDRFNAVASGNHNIGQLKFSSDGTSVYRTNNHKTWTIFNNTKISTTESIMMRHAFCKALENEGLSRDDMNAIRAKLNIGTSVAETAKRGSIAPLSADEVRKVIDEYAGKINTIRTEKQSGARTLATSDEIYRNVSKEEMSARAKTREAINARTLENIADKVSNPPPNGNKSQAPKPISEEAIAKAQSKAHSKAAGLVFDLKLALAKVKHFRENNAGASAGKDGPILKRSERTELAKTSPKAYKALIDGIKAKDEWRKRRDNIMNEAVNPVIAALQAARPFDPANAELVNKIRDFFYGAETVNHNGKDVTPDELFNEIDGILSGSIQKFASMMNNVEIDRVLRIGV